MTIVMLQIPKQRNFFQKIGEFCTIKLICITALNNAGKQSESLASIRLSTKPIQRIVE